MVREPLSAPALPRLSADARWVLARLDEMDDLISLGQKALRERKAAKAVAHFTDAAAIATDTQLEAMLSRPPRGLEARLASDPPNLPEKRALIYRERGRGFAAQGLTDLAITDLSESIRIGRPSLASRLARAELYHHADKLNQAAIDALQVLRLDPDSAKARQIVADCHQRDARISLQHREYDTALECLKMVVAYDPSRGPKLSRLYARAYMGRARYYRRVGRPKLAQADENNAAQHAGAFLARLDDGHALLNQGQPKQAIRELNESVALLPTARAYYLRALAYMKLTEPDPTTAREDLSAAVALQKDYIEALTLRGEVNRLLGDTYGAIRDTTEVIRLRGGDAEAYYQRALAYIARRSCRLAEADLANAEAFGFQRTDDLDAARAGCCYSQALQHVEARRWQAATVSFEKAVAADAALQKHIVPIMSEAYHQCGRVLISRKEYARAATALGKAIRLQPSAVKNYPLRGFARMKLGDWNGTIADLKIARRLDRDSRMAHDSMLATAYRGRARNKLQAGLIAEAEADNNRADRLEWSTAKPVTDP